MYEDDELLDLLHPEPPDRELPAREVLVLTKQFLESDYYRFVFYPRYVEEKDLAQLNARRQSEPNVRLQWLDRLDALIAIEEQWLTGWLLPPDSERRERPKDLMDIIAER